MKFWTKGDVCQADYCKLLELKLRLFDCISKETSSDPENWSSKNPLYGQGAVVAMLIQRIFGGKIMKVSLSDISGYEKAGIHYWNKLLYGVEIDLTAEQFGFGLRNSLPPGEEITKIKDFKKKFESFCMKWGGY